MPRGYFSKGRRSTQKRTRSYSRVSRSSPRRAVRRTSRRNTGRAVSQRPAVIRIEVAQLPGGVPTGANPELPIPPSVRVDKSKKAKL